MFFTVCAQETCEHHQQEEAVGCSNQGFSCAMSETTQDLLTDPHQSLLSEDPVASGSRTSAGMGHWDISFLTPAGSSICPTQLQQVSGSSLTSSTTCNTKTTSAPSDTTDESSPKAQLKTNEPCVQSASAWLDHCKVGGWWKQDLETCRASSGFLPATEPGAAITSGEEFEMFLYLSTIRRTIASRDNEICATSCLVDIKGSQNIANDH